MMTLVYLAVAWLAGLIIGSMIGGPVSGWLIGGILVAGVIAIGGSKQWRPGLVAGGCLIGLALALLRYALAIPTIDASTLAYYNGGDNIIIVRGVVNSPPQIGDKDVRLRLSARAVWLAHDRDWQPVSGDAQVVLALKYRGAAYGDIIELHGKMIAPPDFGDSDSYRQYLVRQGVLSYIQFPSLALIGHDDSPLARVYGAIYTARQAAATTINSTLPQPEGALLVGILLGDRSGMPADLVQNFALTGTAQIVAISGQNISYVAGFILLVGRRLRLRPRTITTIAIVTIVVYTIFVGASASVVRAAIMGALYAIARQFGRDYDVSISLAVAAFLMTLWNPYLLWDIGFQLSFVALLGLVYVAPTISRALHRLPLLGEALAVALAAQLVTEPLILMYFQQVSLIPPLANIVVEPALPLIMLAGAVAVPLLLAFRPLGLLPIAIAWVFLSFMVHAVNWFATLPFAALQLPAINGWWLLPYYLALGAAIVVVEGKVAQQEKTGGEESAQHIISA